MGFFFFQKEFQWHYPEWLQIRKWTHGSTVPDRQWRAHATIFYPLLVHFTKEGAKLQLTQSIYVLGFYKTLLFKGEADDSLDIWSEKCSVCRFDWVTLILTMYYYQRRHYLQGSLIFTFSASSMSHLLLGENPQES